MASAPTASDSPPQDTPSRPVGLSPPPALPPRSAHRQRASHGPLRRYPDRGLLGGVCAGVADQLDIDVLVVRAVMAMVVVAGIGVAIYPLAWALIRVSPESEGMPRPRGAWREAVLIVLVVGAALIVLRHTGLWVGDRILWPLVLGSCGLALVWRPAFAFGAAGGRRSLSPREIGRRLGRVELPRLVLGVLLVAFAAASLLHGVGVQHSLGKAFGAVAIVAVMGALLVAPWVVRIARTLASERTARIREQERAEVAAHLHDSVLQTLALIQKRAGDPREVAGLARRQERELRDWLHERPAPPDGQDSVARALERAAGEVEELHRVAIEVVTVGDRPLDGGLEAMVQAAREAMTNAAKFAACERVDLYAEVQDERVEMFVRDRGVGFDPAAVPADRRGVRDSIVARMERHHGSAVVRSAPGEGTEVELTMECPSA